MPSANGRGPKRAILYARVSTNEQARRGYSLAQQIEALRGYAAREGYEVIEEVEDPGQSGASMDRPGLDRVRDLVEAGGVSVVLAQDRDRFAREPAYHHLLRREFEERGTALRAMNDRGDDTPEGELTDGILDQLGKYERAKIVERSRRGKLQKARQGKILAGPRPNYGFRYNEARDNYVVDPEAMVVVRRLFHMVGYEGVTMNAARRAFQRDGVRSPAGSKRWSPKFVRDMIHDDVYRSHAYDEVAPLVAPDVAARLDPDKRYGIWWFNKRRYESKQVATDGPEGRRYRRRVKAYDRPRAEMIAVPVPDPGIPPEWVDAARAAIRDNKRPSSASDRVWELSGGILRCGDCGNSLAAHTTRDKKRGTSYPYYRCHKNRQYGPDYCSHLKHHRAERIEATVWAAVSAYMEDPERLRADLERALELARLETRGDPDRDAAVWAGKLAEIERRRVRFQDMAADDLITFDELRARFAELDGTRELAQRELAALRARAERIEELERDAEAILESHARMTPSALLALTPERRQRFYKLLGLRVIAFQDGHLEIEGTFIVDGPIIVDEAEGNGSGFRNLDIARPFTTFSSCTGLARPRRA